MKMSLRAPMPPSIAECFDRLDALLAASPSLFSPGRRAARDDEIRRLLVQLREILSQDARQAAGLQQEAEAVLRRAQDEARQIVMAAEEHARQAFEDGTLIRAAEQQGQQIREQAIREADETRRGADLYALGVLERLEQDVARILATVQRGKAILSERTGARAAARAAPARLDNGKVASI